MGEPLNPQLPFFPLSSIINLFQKLVEAVNAIGRARHCSLIVRLRKPTSLQSADTVFLLLQQVNPCECVPSRSSSFHLSVVVHSDYVMFIHDGCKSRSLMIMHCYASLSRGRVVLQ